MVTFPLCGWESKSSERNTTPLSTASTGPVSVLCLTCSVLALSDNILNLKVTFFVHPEGFYFEISCLRKSFISQCFIFLILLSDTFIELFVWFALIYRFLSCAADFMSSFSLLSAFCNFAHKTQEHRATLLKGSVWFTAISRSLALRNGAGSSQSVFTASSHFTRHTANSCLRSLQAVSLTVWSVLLSKPFTDRERPYMLRHLDWKISIMVDSRWHFRVSWLDCSQFEQFV